MSNEAEAADSHTDNTPANDNLSAPTPIVGIGASAGGLEALEVFFDGLGNGNGLAYVVVQHLSPDFKSMMGELLSRHTFLPVSRVEDGMPVEPDHVYLIPPNKEMIVSDSRFLLTDKEQTSELSLPVDTFFRSMASELGVRCVAVVLSGTGSDGSRGVRSIHDEGGVVIAQDPDTAQFGGMPQSAIDTGCVDLTMPTDEMGGAIARFAGALETATLNIERDTGDFGIADDAMSNIFALLHQRYRIDFASYRTTTVSRRVERRLQFLGETSLSDYAARLENDEPEVEVLYHDLLIGVTRFFRDAEAYERLSTHVIPEIFERHENHQPIRAWVAACATGEEAYSIAILFDEEAQRRGWQGDIKIFATDVHEHSVQYASTGVFSAEQLHGIETERIENYFVRTGNDYMVAPILRQLVVFAHHNLMRDPPFTKLDLVSCRNMLIYLQSESQRKVISLLHFGLRPGGALILGPSESPGELQDEFQCVDLHWRIYRKRRDVSLLREYRPPTLVSQVPRAPRAPERISTATTPRIAERQVISAYEHLAKLHIPPSFIINQTGDLIYITAGGADFLHRQEGFRDNNLLQLVDADLQSTLSGLLQRVVRERLSVTYSNVAVKLQCESIVANLTVAPIELPSVSEQCYVVTITNPKPRPELEPAGENTELARVSRQFVDDMESELRHARQDLQSTVQQLETSNEELQASNEELIAANEELQSTNEELHSVNEELHSVNVEHQKKISELSELTDDMDNLLRSTESAALFLDEDLCVRKFAPGVKRVFQVVDSDIGRKLDTFAHTLVYEDLFSDLQQVLRTQKSIETEVEDEDRTHFLVRMIPYRSSVDARGVILSLVDLTYIAEARKELETSEQKFRGTFENAAVGMAHVALDGTWLDVNQRLCDILGYEREELLTFRFHEVTDTEDAEADIERLNKLIRGDIDRYSLQKRYLRKNGRAIWVNLTVSLQRDSQGEPMFCISVVQDITPRKRFEQELKNSIQQRDRFLAILSHELRNPLSALLHGARLIARSELNDQQDAHLQVVLRQSDQISRLLDDLLDVSRVTQDKIVLDVKPMDLNEVVSDATDTVKAQSDAESHFLNVSLPDTGTWVDGDRTRILQVLENLLSNATKYTPPGGRIDITLQELAGEAVITVTDNGRGLTPEMLPAIFDMFVQSEASREVRRGGMGLGLTLVKNLVELHGGTVAAESAGPDQGSTFTVRLPLTDRRPSERETAHEDESRVKHGAVLIVEDQDDAREMLAETLRLDGFEVLTAADGDQGLATILHQRPSVALVDIDLPGLTGLQVAKQVRKTLGPETVTLVALTGFGRASDRNEAITAGFDEHLVKPVKSDELYRVLTKPADGASG